ncbi:MAG: RluA family pseudouridine synthase [Clostridia bacterium]|nr:RluA family pseudouridine synthase [Clostridia bacterium]
MNKKEFKVKQEIKLSKAIINELPFFDYAKARALINAKDAKINGARVKDDVVLTAGDVVTVFYEQKQMAKHYNLVFIDDNVIAVDKLDNIETINSKGDSLYDELRAEYGEIYAIHRLDRRTSGLVIFARNRVAENELLTAFKNRLLDKKYHAIVKGQFNSSHAILKNYCVKDAKNSIVKVIDKPTPNAVEIITEYKVIKTIGSNSLVEITLHTGRTHQIRAHMAYIGHQVIGDGKYGVADRKDRLKLASVSLKFDLPKDYKLNYLNNQPLKVKAWFE